MTIMVTSQRNAYDTGFTAITIIAATPKKRAERTKRTLVSHSLKFLCNDVPDFKLDHCIEMLRIKAICNADLSLTTFRWFSGDMLHATAEDLAEHQCVKEDTLMDWMRDRTVHLSRPGVLKTVG